MTSKMAVTRPGLGTPFRALVILVCLQRKTYGAEERLTLKKCSDFSKRYAQAYCAYYTDTPLHGIAYHDVEIH